MQPVVAPESLQIRSNERVLGCGSRRATTIAKSGEAKLWAQLNAKILSPSPSQIRTTNFIKNSAKNPCPISIVDESSYNTLLISMPGAENAQEATGTPDPIERGFATLNTLK